VPIARERTARLRGDTYADDEVWVVGDTANDLACARAGGARCLLVATGRYLRPDLEVLGADAVLADLSATEAVIDLLLGP
jgi:phosphoglycolate phosphatase-like HAD superfamily hydrolase